MLVYCLLIFLIIIIFEIAYDSYGKLMQRREEERRSKAPCKHGVKGALYGTNTCIKCQREKEEEDARIKAVKEQENRELLRKKAEEEATRKATKEREYREWLKNIRLPEYLRQMDPEEFEHLICNLFKKMGYEVEHTSYSGDSGIDGYLRKEGNLSILQCKRVKGYVGEPVLRDLFGTMYATGAKEGVVVTTGNVSTKARIWANDKPIRILELNELVEKIRRFYREDDVVPENFVPHKRKGSS